MNGSIDLYIGPMFSGKSTMLIKEANKYKSIGKNVLAINHKKDNRYGINKITTHDNNSINCISVNNLNDINKKYFNDYKKSDIIIIEEMQFFNDISFIIESADKYNKKLIISGLDGDYLRKPFQSISNLIPYCDNIVKLKGFCKNCSDGTKSIFSKRIVKSKETILVGGADVYSSVCRKHYLQ